MAPEFRVFHLYLSSTDRPPSRNSNLVPKETDLLDHLPSHLLLHPLSLTTVKAALLIQETTPGAGPQEGVSWSGCKRVYRKKKSLSAKVMVFIYLENFVRLERLIFI